MASGSSGSGSGGGSTSSGEIGNLYVRIGANLSSLHAGLNSAFGSVSSFARSVASFAIGNIVAGGITSAIRGVSNGIGTALAAGSDLNETLSKTEVLLGANAAAASDFAKSLEAKGIGTQAEVLDSMLNTVNMLRNQGVAMTKSLEMARLLESRVGDVASQDNRDPRMIRENLASAMAGEFAILRKYGVMASAEEQQGSGRGAAQYVIEKFLKQTQRAEGDFSRTSMGYANLQRAGDVRMNAVSARIGQDLQIVGQAFQYFRGRFLSSMLALADSGVFKTLGESIYRIMATLGAALEGAAPTIVNGLIYWAESIATFTANTAGVLINAAGVWQVFQNRMTVTLLSIVDGLSYVAEKITFGLVRHLDTAVERAALIDRNQEIAKQVRADQEANRLRIEDLRKRFQDGGNGTPGMGALDAIQGASAQARMTSSSLADLLKGVIGIKQSQELSTLQKIEQNTRPKEIGVKSVTGKTTLAGDAAVKPGKEVAIGVFAWGGFGA
jgi:hypothetical protein